MVYASCLHGLILLGFVLRCGFSASIEDVKSLHIQLFETESYNSDVRPSRDQYAVLGVHIELFLCGIVDVDEKEHKLITNGYLGIHWNDEQLTWDPNTYGDLEYIYLPQKRIWKPDISLQNGFTTLTQLGSDFLNVDVWYYGEIYWRPFQVFESKCNFDETYFPFDQHTCNLDFIAWTLDRLDVELWTWDNGTHLYQESGSEGSNGEWKIVSTSATSGDLTAEGTVPKVRFTITFQRKPQFVIINIIIPVILLAVLNIFTFQIPAESGERICYAVTVWLAFAVFLEVISSSLPQNSDTTPIISVYIMIQLAIGTVTVSITAAELRMVSRSADWEIPSWLKYLAHFVQRRRSHKCGRMSRKIKQLVRTLSEANDAKNAPEISAEVAVTWFEAVAAIDYICFRGFSVFLALSTTIVMIITVLKHQSYTVGHTESIR